MCNNKIEYFCWGISSHFGTVKLYMTKIDHQSVIVCMYVCMYGVCVCVCACACVHACYMYVCVVLYIYIYMMHLLVVPLHCSS